MKISEKVCCKTCDFCKTLDNQPHCVRFPPTVIPMMQKNPINNQTMMSMVSIWPAVKWESMWCGEYQNSVELKKIMGEIDNV